MLKAAGLGSAAFALGAAAVDPVCRLLFSDSLCTSGAAWAGEEQPSKPLRKINLAWTPVGVCLSPVALAQQRGIFERHGLSVEFVSFGSSTEMLLEALATGKADAGVGMALRWLKPLEQGFDVKIVAGTHGGCMRVLAAKSSGVTEMSQLRGKTIGVADMASPARNFFAIQLVKLGIDIDKEIDWRVYPADILNVAADKGEIHAIAHWDPDTYRFLKTGHFVEIGSNQSGEYARRACCVIGIGGKLLREDLPAASSLTKAILAAHQSAFHNPEQVAEVYASYQPKYPREDVVAMLRSEAQDHHPIAADLKRELALYAGDLKLIRVLKPSTDPVKFAERIYADVLSA